MSGLKDNLLLIIFTLIIIFQLVLLFLISHTSSSQNSVQIRTVDYSHLSAEEQTDLKKASDLINLSKVLKNYYISFNEYPLDAHQFKQQLYEFKFKYYNLNDIYYFSPNSFSETETYMFPKNYEVYIWPANLCRHYLQIGITTESGSFNQVDIHHYLAEKKDDFAIVYKLNSDSFNQFRCGIDQLEINYSY